MDFGLCAATRLVVSCDPPVTRSEPLVLSCDPLVISSEPLDVCCESLSVRSDPQESRREPLVAREESYGCPVRLTGRSAATRRSAAQTRR
jgi:hypothetical protein